MVILKHVLSLTSNPSSEIDGPKLAVNESNEVTVTFFSSYFRIENKIEYKNQLVINQISFSIETRNQTNRLTIAIEPNANPRPLMTSNSLKIILI